MDQRQIAENGQAAVGQAGTSELQDVSLSLLLELLSKRFNEEELRTLCFTLNVEYDDLKGQAITGKARELITFLKRRQRIGDLVAEGKKQRPDIAWDDLHGAASEAPRMHQPPSAESSLSQEARPFRQNPYIQRGPISDPGRFYGRSNEATAVLHCLGDLQSISSISLVGPRQVGKTSMLYHIKDNQVLKQHGLDPKQFVFVFINCELLGDCSQGDLFREVLKEVRRSISYAGSRVDLTRALAAPATNFDDFRTALTPIRDAGLKLLFLFDEFEWLCQNSEFGFPFSARLYEMTRELRVSFVTVSHRGLSELGHEGRELAPSFLQLFQPLPIGLFDDFSALALIREPSRAAGVKFSDETEEFILGMADHHPLFLQSACFWAVERQSKEGTLEDGDYQWLRDKVGDCVKQDLMYAWDKLPIEQRQTVSALETVQDDPKLAETLRSLHEQGVISRKDKRFSLCRLWADFVSSQPPGLPRRPQSVDIPPPPMPKEPVQTPDWLPLKLQMTRQKGLRFEVRALETPMMGESKAAGRLPYDTGDSVAVLKVLERRTYDPGRFTPAETDVLERLGLLRNSRLVDDWLQRTGEGLYKVLFPGDVRLAATATFNQALRERRPIFLQLRFDEDAVDLARYPWELVHDGRRHLCSGGTIEMVRYIAYPEPLMPMHSTPPWRLLYLAARPNDLSPLPPESERNAVWTGLQSLVETGKLTLEQLTVPTYDAFLDRMDAADYDIIHFDGHGVFARRCTQCRNLNLPDVASCRRCKASLDGIRPLGYLAFENDSGNADFVRPEDMGNVLRTKSVRLVFLSACQSSVVGGESLFGGLGPGLIGAGVPAVVAMQFSVPVDAAITFARSFYKTLARGETVARAVAHGRQRVFRDETWYIPTLYLRSQDDEGRLFGA